MAAKGAAERTRMRRIRRIGPIYGATCHRHGFRGCEILADYSTARNESIGEEEEEKKEDSVPTIFDIKSGEGCGCEDFDVRVAKGSIS